jgi:hypothetical protein
MPLTSATNPTVYANENGNQPATQLDNSFGNAYAALNALITYSNGFDDTGAANAYVISLPAGLTFSLVKYVRVQVKIANANTGASTLNAFGSGATAIVNQSGAALSGGELLANHIAEFMYDGASWQILSSGIVVGSAVMSVSGLTGTGQSGGATKMQFSARSYVFRNASGVSTVLYNTGSFTVDTSVSGPAVNGRDQAGAFSNGAQVYFYAIWNGATLGGIVSTVAPTTFAGPALPGGYTYWCYLTSVVLVAGGVNVPIVNQAGHRVFYPLFSNQALGTGLTATTDTQLATATVNLYVPTNALSIWLQAQASVSNLGAAGWFEIQVGASSANYILRAGATAGSSASGGSHASGEIPYISAGVWYKMALNAGSAPTYTSAVYCVGYTVPNGDS